MNPRFPIGLLRLSIALISLLTAGSVSSHAQGIGFQFTASSYTAVLGQNITASVSMESLSDPYEEPIDEYGDTVYGYATDWSLHSDYEPLYEEIEVTDSSGDPVDALELNWATGVTGTETFSISNPNSGVAGPDFVGYLFTDNDDPDYGDDYYWALCYPSDFSGYSAIDYAYALQAFTNYNPNTVISFAVNGSSQLTNSEPAQSTDLRIYRSDTYNHRTVNYSVSGTAVNGSDYTATLGGSVQFTAGGSNYVDILVSTLNPLTTAKTLTLTITSDSLGTYQGVGNSATITFEPYVAPDDPADTDDPDDGSAQMYQPGNLPYNGINVGNQKNGGSGMVSNAAVNLPFAIMNVQAISPYATGAGPTPGLFTISRSGGTNAFTLNYTVSGTASAGVNYTALPASVTFAANQTSTNLSVNVLTNNPVTTAQTVVLTLNTGTNYFLGYNPQAVVTLLPNSSLTNSLASTSGRYYRGSGSDPTYWSQVIPLDYENGTVYSNLNGNATNLYPGLSGGAWSSQTLYHYNATNSLSQTNTANRIRFNNPIVAFGERTGGTPLYFSQPYNFGIYAGDPLLTTTQIVIQVYSRQTTASITTNVTIASNLVWNVSTMPQADWFDVTYGDGTFVAIGGNDGNGVACSTNGINWTLSTLPFTSYWWADAYGGNTFVAVDFASSSAAYSTNGSNWTAASMPNINNWDCVAYGNSTFVAVADNGPDTPGYPTNAAYSVDGVNWMPSQLPSAASWEGVIYGNGKFVAVNGGSNDAYSTNGINWTASSMPPGDWSSVAYGDGIFVAESAGQTNTAYSVDGVNWTVASPLPSAASWFGVAFGGSVFATVAPGTNAAYSDNGTNWFASTLPISDGWSSVAYGNGQFVAVSYYDDTTNAVYSTFSYTTNVTYTTNYYYPLAGTISVVPPNYFNTNSMVSYATNGFQVTTNAFGLSTTLSDSPDLNWGTTSLGAYVLTHTASAFATNYYYLVEVSGYPAAGSNAMVIAANGAAAAPSLLYSLEFEARPPWRSVALDEPNFNGSPLPPFYDGMTLAEMLTNTPPVTNAVSFSPSAATNLDDSPELRRHPILDNFVASMGNDPIALANYVINQIDLTDPMDYSDSGSIAAQAINPGGVSRGALGTFLEKQGSPIEQCALLVYLLRQAGVPAVYEFAPPNGLMMLDARLSEMLKFQVTGAVSEAGQLYTTNTMIPVNYPWVAAYIGTNWVHIFPWMKDYEISEGFNLYDYMPTNYSSAYPWVRDYIYGNTNLLSLATNGDNTPSVIFPAYLNQMLLQNHPGISVDDIGVQILNRQNYYSRWQDFPTPTWVTNVSTPLESLTSSGITNISPTLTNIFNTVSVDVYSVSNPTNNIQTGSLRLVDLHDREFYIYQTTNSANTNLVQLSLILLPFRTNVTTQLAFTNDSTLLSREVLTMNLGTNENQLGVRFAYQRNQGLSAASPIDPSIAFLGYNGTEDINLERPLLKGDQAAICMDYGRVTPDMLNVHATDIWQMENVVQLNPSLASTVSPDLYEGAVMYLAGMSYYKKVSDFNEVNQNLNKINTLSSWAVGLSKISAARNQYGNLTNGIDPVLPNVDMFFYETAYVGNGTVQPDSGEPFQLAQQNFNLLSIVNNSAEEHQIINQFYQQTNAVSTVRLLQLSQSQGTGIVSLNYNNYIAEGQITNQGKALENWDASLWSQVASALQNSPYTIAYMTPGPMTNSAYVGMAALILGWNQWEALISPQSLNGAFGVPLAANAVGDTTSYDLTDDGEDDFTMTMTAPPADSQLAPVDTSSLNFSNSLTQILDSQVVNSGFDSNYYNAVNTAYNSPTAQTPQNNATAYQDSKSSGFLGEVWNGVTQYGTAIADPVETVTGEYYINETDLQLPGPLPLALNRNYSSQNLADNQFGTGWKLSLMPYLSVTAGATNIYAADMDGTVLSYVQTNASVNVWMPSLAANPQLNNNTTAGVGGLLNRLRDRLVQTVSGSTTNYTLYGADGSTRVFQVISFNNGILNQTRPYLLSWTDSRGNYYTFTYGTNFTQPNFGQVTRIQSSNGNYLGLDYDINGHIIDAYTGDGRWLYYDYDDYGDLTTVTLPDNTTRSYIYQHATQAVTNGVATYSTHLIIEEDKPDGRVLQNAYDGQRRVTNQLSTAGTSLTPIRTATFNYANNFSLTNSYTNSVTGYTLVIDGNGNTNRFDYTNSLITKITDPLGQTIQQFWYPDNASVPGYPRSVEERIDKRGLVTQYQYDANGDVTNTVITGDITGNGITTQTATNTAVYNTNCLPVQKTDPIGNSVVTIYDPVFNFLPSQMIRFSGGTPVSTNLTIYGDATNVVFNGSITQTNLAFGLPIRQIRAYESPDAATNDLIFNGNGFLTESIRYSGTSDPNVTNTFNYNERGDQVSAVDALGAVTFSAYDPMDRPIETENYDEFGNPLALKTIYYDGNGEVSWTDGPRYNPDNYVFYDYDGAGRVTTEIHWRSQANNNGTGVATPAGYNLYAQTFYEYDPLGNRLLTVDPRGAMTTNTYDALCRLVQSTHLDTNGLTVLSTDGYSYEPGGLPRSHTNALGGVITTFYNITGKPEFQSNPDGSTNAWRYYLDGRIYQEIQRNGAYWQTTYDDVNRITVRTFYSAAGIPEATNSFQLDRRGNATARMDEAGNVFTNSFDGLDRVKVSAGPAIVTVNVGTAGMDPSGPIVYTTNVLQEISTNFYDPAGRAETNVNALGESKINFMDALGRATTNQIFSVAGTLVREHYTAYSADHNSVTVTDGSGANAIVHTTWTDTDGHVLLSIAYPSAGATEFTLNQYDLAGNLVSSQHDSSSGGAITNWTTVSYTFDGLNRSTSMVDRDGALTTYAYDPLDDLTNRTLPGSVQMLSTYNTAGQKLQEWLIGGTSGTRTNTYAYFASGSPFAGLLQTKVDGRLTTNTFSYDDFLRVTNQVASGLLPEQNLMMSWQFEPRGFVTNYSEQFASTNTGPTTSVQRSYDPYGLLATESVSEGAFAYSASQTFDAAGRRSMLNIGGASYGFAWRADNVLTGASDPTGSGSYSYDTAGMLTNRLVTGGRNTAILSRDGEGRPLSITNSVNLLPELGETLAWSGDGLLSAHTLYRPDFTDNRSYSYANMSRRVTQEQLTLGAGSTWTNFFVYDQGLAGGPGALTTAGPIGASFGLWWSGIQDAFARVNLETNNAIGYLAYGGVNGQSTLSAWLDNRPIQIMDVGTNTMQWRTFLELTQGAHQLKVSALHPSGFYTAWATNSFTNEIPYQVAADSYDGNGNITNRVWRNASGTTNRTQSLSWDAKGRLREVMSRNANNYGFNWTAVYDGLNRRLATTTVLVSNGVPSTVQPQALYSYFDPQVEFLELGVLLSAAPDVEFLQGETSPSIQTMWKLYGPDLNGTYGGMNGVGGLEGVSPYLNAFNPVISDARGNVLAEVTNGVPSWALARPSGYGAVPGYRPVAFGNGVDLMQSSAWRGREVDVTGYYHLGMRDFDPDSGQWLSYDPNWNAGDPNGQSFCGGDPIDHFDSDGRLATGFYAGLTDAPVSDNASQSFMAGYTGGGISGSYYGTLLGEGEAAVSPSTYINGAESFGNNINTVYQSDGLLAASSYAATSWNVGAVWSGAANINLATGEPVGDGLAQAEDILGGVASTAGILAPVANLGVSSIQSALNSSIDASLPSEFNVAGSQNTGNFPPMGSVVVNPPPNATAAQLQQVQAYVDGANQAVGQGLLMNGRVSTSGALRSAASRAAAVERANASAAGTPYQGQVGHVPDTTWTGTAQPYSWLDLDPTVNSSIGGQANGYPLGYVPTDFEFGD